MTTFYYGLNRGRFNTGDVAAGTSLPSTDLILVVDQLDQNSNPLTKKDVSLALRLFEKYILSNGVPVGSPGADMPAL